MLNKFSFRLSIRALIATWLRPAFSASRVQHVSDLRLKFALRPQPMCASMADIHSATAEIRRGKKEERKEEEEQTTGRKYNGLPYSVGRP